MERGEAGLSVAIGSGVRGRGSHMDSVGGVQVGRKIVTQRRTITEGDFSAMVNLSWETSPLHTDQEYAKTTAFGQRILGGPCIIPFVAGLTGHAWHGMWEAAGTRLIALVGIEGVRFTAPLFPGDTIWVETEIKSLRPTSKPKRALMTVRDVLHKTGGQIVLEMERLILLQEIDTQEAQKPEARNT
jgi:acyl dehydratase